MTYGISGSGKTHTIFGSKFKDEGMIFHAIDHIFKLKTQQEKVAEAKFGPKGEKGELNCPKNLNFEKLAFFDFLVNFSTLMS